MCRGSARGFGEGRGTEVGRTVDVDSTPPAAELVLRPPSCGRSSAKPPWTEGFAEDLLRGTSVSAPIAVSVLLPPCCARLRDRSRTALCSARNQKVETRARRSADARSAMESAASSANGSTLVALREAAGDSDQVPISFRQPFVPADSPGAHRRG